LNYFPDGDGVVIGRHNDFIDGGIANTALG
jgi:hypothetical protein